MIRADEDFDLSIGGDDFSFISANGNILHDELDIEKRLKSLKYDWVADSATKALFKACRIGRTDIIEALISDGVADIHQKDIWDSTPLYYACLCGHVMVVKLLLSHGAKCSKATFEGERCLYGALTDEIREMLIEAGQINSTLMLRDEFDEHQRKLREGYGSDLTIKCIGRIVTCHKFILAARNQYFATKFIGKWADKVIITCKIKAELFDVILDFLYGAHCAVPLDNCEDILELAKTLKMNDFAALLSRELKFFLQWKRLKPNVQSIQTLDIFGDKEQLKNDLSNSNIFNPDVSISNEDGYKISFHKSVLTARSDFFDALFCDRFQEQKEDKNNFTLRCASNIALDTLRQYVYSETTPELDENDDFVQLLHLADYWLLPGLKKAISNSMTRVLTKSNCLDWLIKGRLFGIGRLEDRCIQYLSSHFDELCDDPAFTELIIVDAESIRNRQAEDSIDIVDELKSHFAKYENNFYLCGKLDQKLRELNFQTFTSK